MTAEAFKGNFPFANVVRASHILKELGEDRKIVHAWSLLRIVSIKSQKTERVTDSSDGWSGPPLRPKQSSTE